MTEGPGPTSRPPHSSISTHSRRDNIRDFEPGQYNFYDFGIQDYLVMRQHITLDTDDDFDRSSSGGDYNIGLSISPGPYLSDSELSVGSVDLSVEQVAWEKRIVEEQEEPESEPVMNKYQAKPVYKKSNSSDEIRRGKFSVHKAVDVLQRRASENNFRNRPSKHPLRRVSSSNVIPINSQEVQFQHDFQLADDCGSGSTLTTGSSRSLHTTHNHTPSSCLSDMPPVVACDPSTSSRILCGVSGRHTCSVVQPCLTHALFRAGLAHSKSGHGRRLVSAAGVQHDSRLWTSIERASEAAVVAIAKRPATPFRRRSASVTQVACLSTHPVTTERDTPPGNHRKSAAGCAQFASKIKHKPLQQALSSSSAFSKDSEETSSTNQAASNPSPPEACGSEMMSADLRCESIQGSSSDDDPDMDACSRVSFASFTSLAKSDVSDLVADVEDEPLLTPLERKLVIKKHPLLRNDTNAHILAPPDFCIGTLMK